MGQVVKKFFGDNQPKKQKTPPKPPSRPTIFGQSSYNPGYSSYNPQRTHQLINPNRDIMPSTILNREPSYQVSYNRPTIQERRGSNPPSLYPVGRNITSSREIINSNAIGAQKNQNRIKRESQLRPTVSNSQNVQRIVIPSSVSLQKDAFNYRTQRNRQQSLPRYERKQTDRVSQRQRITDNINLRNVRRERILQRDESEELGQSQSINISALIEEHILSNNMSKIAKYNLSQDIILHDRFKDVERYILVLQQLLKYQIIEDVNQRISLKGQEKYQKEVKVQLTSQVIKLKNQVILIAQDKVSLQEFLLKGKKLGIITQKIPFQKSHLQPNSGVQCHLCFIHQKDQQCIVTGLPSINNMDTLYYIDLEEIVSHTRQYQAVTNFQLSPLRQQVYKGDPNIGGRKIDNQRNTSLDSNIMEMINNKLNKCQSSTIMQLFVRREGLFFIQGPPGTGKTETLVNFISLEHSYLRRKQQGIILVCTQSNHAVNHIIRKVIKEGLIGTTRKPNLLRIGTLAQYDQTIIPITLSQICESRLFRAHGMAYESRANLLAMKKEHYSQIENLFALNRKSMGNDITNKVKQLRKQIKIIVKKELKIRALVKAYKKEYQQIMRQQMEKCEILFSTLSSSGKNQYLEFFRQKVACIIIDEGGQATQPSTLIPFQYTTPKILFFGDPMQLQPTVMSKNARRTKYNRSIFQRIVSAGHQPFFLDTQYRMLPALRQFPSNYFYEGKLKDGNKNAKIPNELQFAKFKPLHFINVIDGKEGKQGTSFSNQPQAMCVFQLSIKLLLKNRNLTIGIIAPYNGQVKLIDTLCFQKLTPQQKKQVKVSSVDAFQGQERDVIIITCVRENQKGDIGFVKDQKRLNVSITRAKFALFVFGSARTLQNQNIWKSYIDHNKNQQAFHSIKNEGEIGHLMQEISQNKQVARIENREKARGTNTNRQRIKTQEGTGLGSNSERMNKNLQTSARKNNRYLDDND